MSVAKYNATLVADLRRSAPAPMVDAGAADAAEAGDTIAKLGVAATLVNSAAPYLESPAAGASKAAPTVAAGLADLSLGYGLYKEYKAKKSGNCF